jgi:tryptophanyl-tRNA synthetase
VADLAVDYVRPIRIRTEEWLADPGELDRVLALGAERAESVAAETLRTAYDRVGLLPRKS